MGFAMRVTKQLQRVAMGAVLVLAGATSAFAQLPGAVFTTTMTGSRVNANIYQAKCSVNGVWLDGGPGPHAPQGAAGLPDGDYYFQVTDPSGKTLLSTDPVMNRQFQVTAGIISGLSGSGNHNTSVDLDHNATTVELCPYLDTPNPGGVYKVWITPVEKFSGNPTKVDNACGHGCFHGFIPSFSKTDNFKVKGGPSAACLEILKVIDSNGNGQLDGNSVDPLVSWPVTIVDPLGTTNTFWTGVEKECTFAQLPVGLYTITEGATDGSGTYAVTINWVDGAYLRNPDTSVLVRVKNNATRELVFGNAPTK
jgi:hypothetical protein